MLHALLTSVSAQTDPQTLGAPPHCAQTPDSPERGRRTWATSGNRILHVLSTCVTELERLWHVMEQGFVVQRFATTSRRGQRSRKPTQELAPELPRPVPGGCRSASETRHDTLHHLQLAYNVCIFAKQ